MSNKKQRESNRANARMLMRNATMLKRPCPNCNEMLSYGDGHFIMPCLGEPGRFTCTGTAPVVIPESVADPVTTEG